MDNLLNTFVHCWNCDDVTVWETSRKVKLFKDNPEVLAVVCPKQECQLFADSKEELAEIFI